MSVDATVTVTDGDGDTVSDSLSADLGDSITIVDDVPTLELDAVDLDDVTFKLYDKQTDGGTSKATGNVAAAFEDAVTSSYGADGAGSIDIAYALSVDTALEHGLTSGGEAIAFTEVDGVIIGSTEAGEVLRIEIDAITGEVTVTQSAPLDHAAQGKDSLSLPVGLVSVDATVTVTDGDGDTVSDSLSADLGDSITIVDDMPTAEVAVVDLSELDLTTFDRKAVKEGGDVDSANVKAAFLAAVTPSYGADGEGGIEIGHYALKIENEETGLQSQGVDIKLTMDGGDVVGMADGTEVFRLSVDENGEVTLTQSAVIDHPEQGKDLVGLPEDSVTLNAVATVTDGDGDAVTVDVSADLGGSDGVVNFTDAVPMVEDSTVELEALEVPPFYANVSLALDISSSMYGVTGGGNVMPQQKAAAIALLQRYADALETAGDGEVKVQIIQFGTNASNGGWMSIEDAMDMINGIPDTNPGGTQYTNYTDALNSIMDHYDGRVDEDDVLNHSYFLTDGEPLKAAGWWGTEPDPVPESVLDAWAAFLDENDILSYAIGMGDNPTAEHLLEIAYNGLTGEDHDDLLHLDIDFDALEDLLTSLAPEPVSHHLDIDFGADGGYILSITVDGKTYTYDPGEGEVTGGGEFDPATNELTVVTEQGGTFTLNMQTGAYTYEPPEQIGPHVGDEKIDFTIIDNDGDKADATLTIKMEPGEAQPPSLDLDDTPLVVNEKFLENGSAEGEGELTQNGVIHLSAEGGIKMLTIEGEEFSLDDLQALEGEPVVIELESGNTLTLTGFDGSLTGGTLHYEFTLNSAIDHELGGGTNSEIKAFDITLEDLFGEKAESSLDIKVIDDTPVEQDVTDGENEIVIDDFQVTDISGTWKNAQGGSSSVVNHLIPNGTGIVWGGTNFNNGSGYKFEYASTVDIEASAVSGEPVSLGTFTHVNQPISSGTAINGVTLELTVEVMLNGVVYNIPVEVVLDHEETPNNAYPDDHPDNDDIVTIESVKITDQGVLEQLEAAGYKFDIPGFKDKDGNLVTQVRTVETESTDYDLFASVSYVGDDLVDSEGEFDVSWGADGPADEDDEHAPITFTGADGQEVEPDASGKAEIVGEYGTLSVTVIDGKVSYEYTLSTAGREKLKTDGSLSEGGLSYTLTDADGDRITSQIDLEFTAVSAPIELVDSSNDAFIDLVDQESDPEPVMGNVSSTAGVFGGSRSTTSSEEFTIGSGETGQVSFTVSVTGSSSVSWTLIDENGQEIGSGSRSSDGSVDIQVEEGTYRLEITTSGSGFGPWLARGEASASNINLVTYSQVPESWPVEGNLFAEEGVSLGSNDTWLEIDKDGAFEEVAEGTTIAGQYGTLTLNPDGSYSYTANPSLESLGSVEQFTYQVVNANGDSETATLKIRLDSNTESVIWGTDAGETLDGTMGNDIIVGGAGSDVLTGGEGDDVFKWNFGDQGTTEAPANDVVADFANGNNTLDLADLLQGEDEGSIGKYVFAEEDGDDTVLYISSDGSLAGNKDNADQIIRLEGKSFGDFGAEAGNSGDLISKMIDSGQLQIDQ
ncbi:BapA/Bap/LapF family large adhesin [Billgrantia zhangzhouensis]|uniref:BapA/Bap/LapF family large adhesin n=1 Tax=Billgrantia zhangzhouensis TaxID=2733481 RepID=UPI001F294E80